MISITPTLSLDESELQFEYIRSSGPGGQNVNKVASACQLRFDLRRSTALPPEAKLRLARLAGSRMTAEGWLVIEAKRYRTQEQNRLDALARLGALVEKALVEPKARKAVVLRAGPGRARDKLHRRKLKQLRRTQDDWE
jgi:ribosome-associated protein